MELTKSELEVMDVFWERPGPLSRADLLADSRPRSWKDSSVHILINGLLQKGAIRETGFVRSGKTYGRTFLPSLTREEYFVSTMFSHRYQPELEGLLTALLSRPEITERTLDHVQALINQR